MLPTISSFMMPLSLQPHRICTNQEHGFLQNQQTASYTQQKFTCISLGNFSNVNVSNQIETLAYNSLYDVYNNRIDALQQQAARADPKQCQTHPTNGQRPGWGDAGYHQIDDGCDIDPASCLGPGLWLDTEFCNQCRQGEGPTG